MSHFLLMVERLPPPLISIDEQAFLIPHAGSNEVANAYQKLVFLLDADCEHEVEGQQRIRCRTGDVLAFPGPCRHRYLSPASAATKRVHAVRLLLTPARRGRAGPAQPSRSRAPALDGLLKNHLTEFRHLGGGVTPAVRELLHRFRDEAERRPLGYAVRVEAICRELIVEVLRQIAPAESSPSVTAATTHGPARAAAGDRRTGARTSPRMGNVRGAGDEASRRRRGGTHLVERAQEWLYKNYPRRITLDDVATELDVSAEHLARAFRKRTGQTLFGYLQTLRLDRAKTLLLGSEQSIAEVAEASGFSSLALFSRTFQKRFDVGPRRYRQRIWESARRNFI